MGVGGGASVENHFQLFASIECPDCSAFVPAQLVAGENLALTETFPEEPLGNK